MSEVNGKRTEADAVECLVGRSAERGGNKAVDEVNRVVGRTEDCPFCAGTGKYDTGLLGTWRREGYCKNCNGTGRRTERVNERSGPPNPTDQRTETGGKSNE